jgi:hypothetical protein
MVEIVQHILVHEMLKRLPISEHSLMCRSGGFISSAAVKGRSTVYVPGILVRRIALPMHTVLDLAVDHPLLPHTFHTEERAPSLLQSGRPS